MYVSPIAAQLVTRFALAPLLSPRIPLPLRRRLIDGTGYTVPSPRGTVRTTGELGGVPVERVTVADADGPQQVLFLHGGGYVLGSPRSHRALTAHLAQAAGGPVHVPDYRLAPEHPYPAGLDDALAANLALRAAGHEARHIAVVGDSAGGGLALALLLRLRARGEELPGAVGLISPLLDLSLSSPTIAANQRTDALLHADWVRQGSADYRAGADAPELHPLAADLTGLPPIHVVAATGEILLGDADAFVGRARIQGAPVTYRREPGLWHDYVLYAGLLKAADETLAELGGHVRTHCG